MAKKKKEEKTAKITDYQVILGPVVTEKAANVGGANFAGIVLKVDRRADKTQIKQAVENIFDVEVAAVKTCNYIGKLKRTGRELGRRAAYKKAYVSLKPGFEVNLFEGI